MIFNVLALFSNWPCTKTPLKDGIEVSCSSCDIPIGALDQKSQIGLKPNHELLPFLRKLTTFKECMSFCFHG